MKNYGWSHLLRSLQAGDGTRISFVAAKSTGKLPVGEATIPSKEQIGLTYGPLLRSLMWHQHLRKLLRRMEGSRSMNQGPILLLRRTNKQSSLLLLLLLLRLRRFKYRSLFLSRNQKRRVASDDEYDDESEPEPEEEVRQPKGNRAQRVNGPAPMTRGSKADSSCWSS